MQEKNGNKRFTTFPTMTNMEKYITDNRDRIPENSSEFFLSLGKGLKTKFLHSMARFLRTLSINMRNLKGLKNDVFYIEIFPADEAVARRCFINKVS